MKNIKNYNLKELEEELIKLNEKKFRAKQIYKWLYIDKVKDFDEMTDLSLDLREKLKKEYTICNYKIIKKQEKGENHGREKEGTGAVSRIKKMRRLSAPGYSIQKAAGR